MENKIPTAEDLIRKQFVPGEFDELMGYMNNSIEPPIVKAMKEFAKLHVKAALEAALESIPCLGSSTDIATYEEVEKEVLNSYPENLIV